MPRDERPILHTIERTRNRHSRAVFRDDTIIIRLARNLSRTEEEQHIQNLLHRMRKQVLLERDKRSIDPFRPLLSGQETITLSTALGNTHVFALAPGKRTRARKTADGWRVEVGPALRRRQLHVLLWSLLAESELPHIRGLIDEINRRTLRVRVRGLRLRHAVSQWGSCSRDGVVMLNTSLLFLSENLLTYVIIHELAHRLHANHSARYWAVVEDALPDWRELRGELRRHRLVPL